MAAIVTRGCESAEIRVVAWPADVPDPRATTRAPDCELRLRRPPRLVGHRLRLGISCAGFRITCSAAVVVRAGGRVVVAGGSATYNHTTPPYAAASFRVNPASPAAAARRDPRAGDRAVSTTARPPARPRTTVVQFPAARR